MRWTKAMGGPGHGDVKHWSEDPRLLEQDLDGMPLTPVVMSDTYAVIGSWEQEREHLIAVVRHLVLEVQELFERLAEHEDDHSHRRA